MKHFKNNYLLALASTIGSFVPFLANAATQAKLSDVITLVIGYLNQILALLMGVAVVAFVFYVIRYFIVEEEKRPEGRWYVVWATVAFAVIFSMWGLVNILMATFNVGTGSPGSWSSMQSLFPQ